MMDPNSPDPVPPSPPPTAPPPTPAPKPSVNPIAYEGPDDDRPASASPTEREIEHETPTLKSLDASPAPARAAALPPAPPSADPHAPTEAGATAHDPYAALRLRAYRLYALSYVLAVIGGQVQGVAIQWQIYDRQKTPLSLGLIGGIQVIPLFLLALPAGHLVDTMSRKKLLIFTQWMLAFWGLVLGYLASAWPDWPGLVPAMYAVVFLNAVTLTFARPARQAILPQLVPKRLFSNAITWNASTFELCMISGPALGGFLVTMFGVASAYYTNAVLLLACALLTLKFPPTPVASGARATRQRAETTGDAAAEAAGNGGPGAAAAGAGEKPGFRSLLAGVRFVFERKLLLATMTLDLFAVLLGGAVYLLPVFARDILHVGPAGFGWLRAAPSFGAFATALVLAHRPPMQKAGRALLLAVTGFGAAIIVFGLSTNFWLSFAMLVLTGAFDNVSVVVRHTLVQLLTPDAMRGRVSAVNQVFIGSSNELGGMESGLTAEWWGPVRAVVAGGVGTILTVALVARLSPELRKFGRLDAAKA